MENKINWDLNIFCALLLLFGNGLIENTLDNGKLSLIGWFLNGLLLAILLTLLSIKENKIKDLEKNQ